MKKKIKILRIIARLNIGGPAIHVALLTHGLDPTRFESTLIAGKVSRREGDMSYVFDTLDQKPIIIPELQRDLNPIKDVKSFLHVLRILRQEKPDIIHTHTAKAGTIGRIAAFAHNLVHRRKVRVVHTFHGHVFRGYFGRLRSLFFAWAERLLARITDVIVVISESQQGELYGKYHIAPAAKFRTVKLGFDLTPFLANKDKLRVTPHASHLTPHAPVTIGIVGRLVPIKNHKMFLESAKIFLEQNPDICVQFLIIGDGELRNDLMAYCESARGGLSDCVKFCGWKKVLPSVYADLDILALTSINEGTPVSIIEAMASSVPVIATDAGGVRDLLGMPNTNHEISQDGFQVFERGILCPQNDPGGFARGLKYAIQNRDIQEEISKSARSFVSRIYSKERLFEDMENLYLELAGERPAFVVEDSLGVERPRFKVLQVYKDYYPPVIGGIEKHLNMLCHGLVARGIHSEVLVSNTRPKTEISYDNSIRITKAAEHGRLQSAPLTASFHSQLRACAQEADILHFHFPNPTAELSLILSNIKKPYVVTYHSDIVRQANLGKLYSPFLIKFLKRAWIIIATSPDYVRSSKVLSQFQNRCRVIPFGVDSAQFAFRVETDREIAQLRQRYGPAIILFVGKFRYYKGLHVLIEAMKNVNGRLLLIGAGPLESEMQAQVVSANLQEKVVFLGELSDQEVIACLHACDVFVLPSILRSEAFGIVLLEAMACGKPVVSTEIGTGTTFVNQHQETGLVVPPNDQAALAQALNYLLADAEIREKYGRAGRERVEKYFTEERMIADIVETYESMYHESTEKLSAHASSQGVKPQHTKV